MSSFECDVCRKEFDSLTELESHRAAHKVLPVKDYPLTVLLTLPAGCTPGGWGAAEEFANAFAELVEKYQGKQFQFIPFSNKDGHLESMLAVAIDI